MKIENIHIDGFGVWNDKTWGPLGPGLNVFHGPNETGKSTLMAFIRAMLFGFEKRGSARRYEPLKGGSHGGSLELLVADTRLRLERKAGRHARGSVPCIQGTPPAMIRHSSGCWEEPRRRCTTTSLRLAWRNSSSFTRSRKAKSPRTFRARASALARRAGLRCRRTWKTGKAICFSPAGRTAPSM